MSTAKVDALFDDCVGDIKRAYDRLGHTRKWRFLGVNKHVLRAPVKIAFLSLNPGGDGSSDDHPESCCPEGNWYMDESWAKKDVGAHKLQQQVVAMFNKLVEHAGYAGDARSLIETSLVGNLIPFRSQDYSKLPNKRETLKFSRSLWKPILAKTQPKLIICLGEVVERNISLILSSSLQFTINDRMPYDTGWHKGQAYLSRFDGNQGEIRLLRLPHLSRFTIFTRDKSNDFVDKIIRDACALC